MSSSDGNAVARILGTQIKEEEEACEGAVEAEIPTKPKSRGLEIRAQRAARVQKKELYSEGPRKT